jgi:hypothetical protein
MFEGFMKSSLEQTKKLAESVQASAEQTKKLAALIDDMQSKDSGDDSMARNCAKKPNGHRNSYTPKLAKMNFPKYKGWTIPQAGFVESNNSLNSNELKKEINYPWLPTILRKRRKCDTNYFETTRKLLPGNH